MARRELDPTSGVPLHRQITDILRAEIVDGTADPGRPMTEAQLLERFDVSRAPIRQALRELVTEGFVYRKQGKGTFPRQGARVRRPASVRPGALYQYLAEQGVHPASTVTGIERVAAPQDVHRQLDLEDDEKVVHFWRVIAVEGAPIAQAEVYIRAPEAFIPTAADLEDRGSAFELLEKRFGITLDHAVNDAWATPASAHQAATLGVPEGSALLAIETIFFTIDGVPAGWRSAVHIADDFRYQFVTGR